MLLQLQSCALPAELRRVDELDCSRDDNRLAHMYLYYKIIELGGVEQPWHRSIFKIYDFLNIHLLQW
jgi:hypothetical protein